MILMAHCRQIQGQIRVDLARTITEEAHIDNPVKFSHRLLDDRDLTSFPPYPIQPKVTPGTNVLLTINPSVPRDTSCLPQ